MKKYAILFLMSLAFVQIVPKTWAWSYAFQDFGGIKFQTISGTTVVTQNVEFAIGYFKSPFDVSGSSVNLTNFFNLNTDGSGGSQWSSAFDFGDPSTWSPSETFITVGTAGMDSNSNSLLTTGAGSFTPVAGTQLYLVGRSTSLGFSFALSNAAWTVKTNSANDLGGYEYSWGQGMDFANASIISSNATFAVESGANVITVVPEPSTGALMMIGAAGLVALRRLRKV